MRDTKPVLPVMVLVVLLGLAGAVARAQECGRPEPVMPELAVQDTSSEFITIGSFYEQAGDARKQSFIEDLRAHDLAFDDVSDVEFKADDSANRFLFLKPANSKLKTGHLLYLGVRVGFDRLGLASATYVRANGRNPVFHVDFETSPLTKFSMMSVGGGYYPWKSGFYVGGRVHRLTFFDPFNEPSNGGIYHPIAVGPEIGIRRVRGRFMGWGSVGASITKSKTGTVPMTWLRLGISYRLFK